MSCLSKGRIAFCSCFLTPTPDFPTANYLIGAPSANPQYLTYLLGRQQQGRSSVETDCIVPASARAFRPTAGEPHFPPNTGQIDSGADNRRTAPQSAIRIG